MRVNLPRYKCSKCGHEWSPKQREIYRCPECKCSLEQYPPEELKVE
jgi:predicted  nucleic acid-binding Zn-ribbon protein